MKKERSVNMTIIIAAIIIAGGMVFLGLSLRAGSANVTTAESFEDQLLAYQGQQEAKQKQAQIEQQNQRAQQAKNVAPISQDDHVLGAPDAQITIFEYSDFECPFCKRFAETPREVVEGSDGKVNTVFRHFPLGFHDPLATQQAIASECAAAQGGADAFYAYHDIIFATTRSNGKGMKEEQFPQLAVKIGLNGAIFKECLASGKYDAHVQSDIRSGANAGITGTPGVIIKNNKTGDVRVMPGAVPTESVQAAVNELLAS